MTDSRLAVPVVSTDTMSRATAFIICEEYLEYRVQQSDDLDHLPSSLIACGSAPACNKLVADPILQECVA